MATIYPKNVIAAVSKSAKLKEIAQKKAKKEFFDPAVRQLLEDFDNHPVTIEILGGANAENISGTLPSSSHGNMNLFSFIGFRSDLENPVNIIRRFLNPNSRYGLLYGPRMKYIRGSRTNEGEYQFLISPPDIEEIYRNSPLPWAQGISWVYRMEKGISGVAKFLNTDRFQTPEPSRSGGGLQVKKNLRGSNFRPVPYFTELLRDFLNNAKSGLI